eukprot:TCONS_00059780-protein
MAFFCPYGSKGNKEAAPKPIPHDAYQRNREYDDLEDNLDRLSLKENRTHQTSLMIVVEDYYPCSALELPVRKGEIVQYIQSEGVWTYVRARNGADGYIPRRHCCLVDPAELSDVGYFSDHQNWERVSPPSTGNSRTSSFQRDSPRSVRFVGANINRDGSFSFSSTTSSLSSSSPKSLVVEPLKRRSGLYTDGPHVDNNRLFDRTPKQLRKNTALMNEDMRPVCGRKCGENCEHKNALKKDRTFSQTSQISGQSSKSRADSDTRPRSTSSNQKLKKSSVISVSTKNINKSVSFNEIKTKSSQLKEIKTQSSQLIFDDVDGRPKTPTEKSYFELPHTKCGHPELIIIQKHNKKSETDISVDRGDYAAIINDTKYDDWMYIVNEAGERGFIPKNCAIKHECHDCQENATTPVNENPNKPFGSETLPSPRSPTDDKPVYTTEDFKTMRQLVITKDYSGHSLDDLYVCIGDIVYMSPDEQSGDEWLWVHSLKLNSSGYIPICVSKDMMLIQKASV